MKRNSGTMTYLRKTNTRHDFRLLMILIFKLSGGFPVVSVGGARGGEICENAAVTVDRESRLLGVQGNRLENPPTSKD